MIKMSVKKTIIIIFIIISLLLLTLLWRRPDYEGGYVRGFPWPFIAVNYCGYKVGIVNTEGITEVTSHQKYTPYIITEGLIKDTLLWLVLTFMIYGIYVQWMRGRVLPSESPKNKPVDGK